MCAEVVTPDTAAEHPHQYRMLFKDKLLNALVDCYRTDNANALQYGICLDKCGPHTWTFITCAKLASRYLGMHPNTYTKDLRQYGHSVLMNKNVRVLASVRMGAAADNYYWNVYQVSDELQALLNERIAAIDDERATQAAEEQPEQRRQRIRLLVSKHLSPLERHHSASPGLEYYDTVDTLVSLVH